MTKDIYLSQAGMGLTTGLSALIGIINLGAVWGRV